MKLDNKENFAIDISGIVPTITQLPSSPSSCDEMDARKYDTILSASIHDMTSNQKNLIFTSDIMIPSNECGCANSKDSPAGLVCHSDNPNEFDSPLNRSENLNQAELQANVECELNTSHPSSAASNKPFLSHSLPNSTRSTRAAQDQSEKDDGIEAATPHPNFEDIDLQLIVDRNRQKFVQRYLITSAIPIRRSYSISSFDYANALADTLQLAEDDRQSMSLSNSLVEYMLSDDHECEHEKHSIDQYSPTINSQQRYPPFSPPHPPPVPYHVDLPNDSNDDMDNIGKHFSRSYSQDTPTHQISKNESVHGNFSQKNTLASVCYICCLNESNACFMKCGHGGICYSCALLITRKYTNQCPICRKECNEILKITKKYVYIMENKLYKFGYCTEGFQVLNWNMRNVNYNGSYRLSPGSFSRIREEGSNSSNEIAYTGTGHDSAVIGGESTI